MFINELSASLINQKSANERVKTNFSKINLFIKDLVKIGEKNCLDGRINSVKTFFLNLEIEKRNIFIIPNGIMVFDLVHNIKMYIPEDLLDEYNKYYTNVLDDILENIENDPKFQEKVIAYIKSGYMISE
jgi:hypothetical protein